MERWYRVFGGNEPVDPKTLAPALRAAGFAATYCVATDNDGWFRVEFTFTDGTTLSLDRYSADEVGIRAELNSWAAWIESRGDEPTHVHLMERLIQTAQLFVIAAEAEIPDRACELLCRCLAAQTSGVYQIDGRGLFAADGTLLIAEEW